MYKSIVVKSQLLGAICRKKFHIISKLINLSAFTFNQQLSKIFQVFLFSIQKMDFILDIVNSIWLFHELFLTLNQTFLDLNMPTVKAIYWMENGKTRHIWIVKKLYSDKTFLEKKLLKVWWWWLCNKILSSADIA